MSTDSGPHGNAIQPWALIVGSTLGRKAFGELAHMSECVLHTWKDITRRARTYVLHAIEEGRGVKGGGKEEARRGSAGEDSPWHWAAGRLGGWRLSGWVMGC